MHRLHRYHHIACYFIVLWLHDGEASVHTQSSDLAYASRITKTVTCHQHPHSPHGVHRLDGGLQMAVLEDSLLVMQILVHLLHLTQLNIQMVLFNDRWNLISPTSAGGYIVDFTISDMDSYSTKLEAMMSGKFIDAGTRAVFISFFTFNPATGIVGALQLLCEFTPNGLVLPSYAADAWLMRSESGTYDDTYVKIFMFGLPIVLWAFMVQCVHRVIGKIRDYLYRRKVRTSCLGS